LIAAYKLLGSDPEDDSNMAVMPHESGVKVAPKIDISAFRRAFSHSKKALAHWQPGSQVTADRFLLGQIKDWVKDDSAEAPLWIDDLQTEPSTSVSPIAVGFWAAAEESNVFVAYHFCSKTRRPSDASSADAAMDCLYDLITSLIYQLQNHLTHSGCHHSPVSQERFSELYSTKRPICRAICILGDLWQVVPGGWVCVVDGFHDVEVNGDPKAEELVSDLLRVIYPGFDRPGFPSDTKSNQYGCKTLITTRGGACFLQSCLRIIRFL